MVHERVKSTPAPDKRAARDRVPQRVRDRRVLPGQTAGPSAVGGRQWKARSPAVARCRAAFRLSLLPIWSTTRLRKRQVQRRNSCKVLPYGVLAGGQIFVGRRRRVEKSSWVGPRCAAGAASE